MNNLYMFAVIVFAVVMFPVIMFASLDMFAIIICGKSLYLASLDMSGKS